MKVTRSTVITALAVLVLATAIPSALRDTLETGRIYLFSPEFLSDLPRRLSGPGRLRFVLQPVVAILLGFRSGVGDARAGRPPYLVGLLFHSGYRREYLRTALATLHDIVALSIVLDVVSQLLIFRQVHPGAALVVGPLLIGLPYAAARGAGNRYSRLGTRKPPLSPTSPPTPS